MSDGAMDDATTRFRKILKGQPPAPFRNKVRRLQRPKNHQILRWRARQLSQAETVGWRLRQNRRSNASSKIAANGLRDWAHVGQPS